MFMKQPKLWMQLIETEAPHLRQALQQEEHQDPQLVVVGPAAPFSSAEGLIRAWLKSCRRYRHSELLDEEEKKMHKKRLQGCSLVMAFFRHADDKEPMAQLSIPCDDEATLAQAFDAKRHVMLEPNEQYEGDPGFFDPNHPWEEPDADAAHNEKLAPTRVLMYIVDAQRGRFVHLLHCDGEYNGVDNFSNNPGGFEGYYKGDNVSPQVDPMDLYRLGMSIMFFWPAEERGDEACPAGIYLHAEILLHGHEEPSIDQVYAWLYAKVASPAFA